MHRGVRARRVVAVLVVMAAAAGCSDGSSPKSEPAAKTQPAPKQLLACGAKTTQKYAQYEGVDINLTSLDLWRPKADANGDCSNRPLVVWIHGGGWWEGDKTDDI